MWLGRARRWGEFKVIIWARQAAKGGLFFIGGVNSSKQHGVSILFDGFIVLMTPDKMLLITFLKINPHVVEVIFVLIVLLLVLTVVHNAI